MEVVPPKWKVDVGKPHRPSSEVEYREARLPARIAATGFPAMNTNTTPSSTLRQSESDLLFPLACNSVSAALWKTPRLAFPRRSTGSTSRTAPMAGSDLRRVTRRGLGLVLAATCSFLGFLMPAADAEPVDNWTPLTISSNALKSVGDLIHVNGEFWGVGSTGRIQHSVNGADWQVVQTPASDLLTSIVYGNGRFVAVGRKGAILSSPNGASDWTLHREPGSGHYVNQVIFANGTFVAAGHHLADGDWHGDVFISPNGTDWTPVNLDSVNPEFHAEGIVWGNGQFVMVGSGPSGWPTGEYSVMTSPDAVTWTRRKAEFYNDFQAVAYIDGTYVAGGLSFLATSPDGITWTKLASVQFQYSNMDIWGIKEINGRLFVFGDYGLLLSSPNGIDWMEHDSKTTKDIAAMAYDGNRVLMFRTSIYGSSTNGPAVSDPWAPVSSGGGNGNGGGGSSGSSSQLANLSTRAWIGSADAQLISGVVIQGSSPKKVLVRAIGPTLGTFGVSGVLADPQVRIVDAAQAEVGANNDWGTHPDQAGLTAATASVGAFDLDAGSKDAVLLTTLQPGGYSIQVSGANGGTGIALVEIYDVDAPGGCKLVNISSRGFVGTGSQVAIPGFVVSGSSPRKLLIRGIGPTLGSFGVAGTIADPTIALFDASQAKVAENDNWQSAADQPGLVAATAAVGAFDLNPGSADAAMLVTVQPGAYTVTVSGVSGATGVALVEIYEVP